VRMQEVLGRIPADWRASGPNCSTAKRRVRDSVATLTRYRVKFNVPENWFTFWVVNVRPSKLLEIVVKVKIVKRNKYKIEMHGWLA